MMGRNSKMLFNNRHMNMKFEGENDAVKNIRIRIDGEDSKI